MAQTILKELTYDGSKVVVEVARRDAQGRVIDTTYATKAELPDEYELPIASASTLGGIKVGAGLSINAESGVLSATGGGTADAVDWSNVESRPFNSVSSTDFVVSETQELQISDTKWATKSYVTGLGYVTTATFNEYINTTAPAEFVAIEGFKANYLDANNVAYKSEIPDTSDFITANVSNLANYYTKSQTYTKTEVDGIVNTLKTGAMQVVAELPGTGEEGIIYLVGSGQPYDMYIWENSEFINIGTTEIDLSGYVPTSRTINGHALTSNVTISKGDVGLSSVVNTGDSSTPTSGGTTKFTTGGAYTMQQSLQSAINGKQATLTSTQLNAVNSGITSAKVSTYDGYASQIAGKQDKLTAGNGITISGTTIASVITATDVSINLV